MNKNGNILVVLFGAVALVSLSLAAYFYLQNQNLQKPKIETAILQPILSPVVRDEKTSWKTYTNTKIGFSVQIPQDEVVTESGQNNDWISVYFQKLGLTIANSPPSIGDPVFKKETRRETLKLSNDMLLEIVLSRRGVSPFEKDGYSDTDEISVVKNTSFTPKYYVNAKVPHNDSENRFSLFNQVLRTFRFLE